MSGAADGHDPIACALPLIIAIDGPAGSGKSTLARRLAGHYTLRFLDTGLLYRAVARRLLDKGIAAANETAAVDEAKALTPEELDGDRLRGEGIGNQASIVAAIPAVREALLGVQRQIAARDRGSVVAGRDIGTVIVPETRFKFFITASIEERARRRHEELLKRGDKPIYARVLDELRERDRRDEARAVAPMTIAADATVIDTSNLSVDQTFEAIRNLVDEKLGASA